MDKIIEFTKNVQFTLGDSVLEIIYLFAAVLFIMGLKMLSHPDSARRGNFIAATGMILAITGTLVLHKQDGQKIGNIGYIFGALTLGLIVGLVIARKVKMTKMPELV